MAHCPSHDWDRYAASEDAAAAAELAFYRTHRAAILAVVAGMLANPKVDPFVTNVVERAAQIVQLVVNRGEPDV